MDILNKIFNFWEKHYLHSFFLSAFLFVFYTLWSNNSFLYGSILQYQNIKWDSFDGTVYPIEFVPDPFLLTYEQRKQNYSDIDSKYFINIPKYDPNVFGKNPDDLNSKSQEYKDVVFSRIVYTVPYLSTYSFDYKEYTWSHPWVDIIAPTWTPVRSIANWVIVDTWSQPSWFWNYVLIRHDNIDINWTKKSIYSLYAHMSKVLATNWSKVKKAELIWEVWKTWTATTPHLHFQIDVAWAPYHPFWPFSSSEMRAAWVWFFDWVNIWLWKESAILNTINSMKFVNDNFNKTLTESDNSEKDITFTNNNSNTWTTQTTTEVKIENKVEQEQNTNTWTTQTWNTNEDKTQDSIIQQNETPKIDDLESENIELLSAVDEEFLLNSKDLLVLAWNNNLVTTEGQDLNSISLLPEESTWTIDSEEELSNLLQSIDEETTSDTLIENSKIFSDIENTYKYLDEVKYFKEKWIIAWFSDNTFRAKSNVTRAESLKIILLSLGISKVDWEESKFNDIKTNSWENTYVNAWVKSWIISTENSYFYPLRNISRVEALKMIFVLSKTDLNLDFSWLSEIKDISSDDWYYDYARYATKEWLLELDEWNFYPNKALTREELVSILYKFVNK